MPRRFHSSILGGDVPFGSRGHHILHVPIGIPPSIESRLKADRIELPRPKSPPHKTTPKPEAPTRVSVIQRVPPKPKAYKKEEPTLEVVTQEPEQEQPIDYAVPKRNKNNENNADDERGSSRSDDRAKVRPPSIGSIARPLLALRLNCPQAINMAASGHGRSGGSSGNGGGSATGGGSSGGGSVGGSSGGGGAFGSGGGGGAGGASGGSGGMNPGGNGGRGNYGPSSPPTGSLPPFYESLKGGNNLANFANQYNGNCYLTPSPAMGMDCENGQDSMNSQYTPQEGKQYSMLQNACQNYGIALKEEDEYKIHPSDLLSGQYNYDVSDGLMVDMGSTVVDPLPFTATLTFNSADHSALLDSLSDAELYLRGLPQEENGNELLDEALHSPSSAGSVIGHDSHISPSVEPSVEPFAEHGIPLTRFDASR